MREGLFLRKICKNTISLLLCLTTLFSLVAASNTITMAATAKKYYYINYNPGGGNGNMYGTKAIYGENNKLRANSFTRLEYSFTGWYAYRTSDKKWFCTNPKSGKNAWFTSKQLSSNKGYKKYLYKNQATVGRQSSKNGDIVTMYAQWKKLSVKASKDSVEYTALLNDHGWTRIEINYNCRESYEISGNNISYKNRSLFAYAKIPRASWDNPYKFSCSDIYHMNSSGKTIHSFHMMTPTHWIHMADGNYTIPQIDREDYTTVTYPKNNSNRGAVTVSVTAQYVLNPYGKVFSYSLKG